jgi:hypothetical protein
MKHLGNGYLYAIEALVRNSQELMLDAANQVPTDHDINLRDRLLVLEESIKDELTAIRTVIAQKDAQTANTSS